jgi:hypothetical protein
LLFSRVPTPATGPFCAVRFIGVIFSLPSAL